MRLDTVRYVKLLYTDGHPYSSARMDMWLCHEITEKRTYLAINLDVKVCDTIVPESEFAAKTYEKKNIIIIVIIAYESFDCILFHLCYSLLSLRVCCTTLSNYFLEKLEHTQNIKPILHVPDSKTISALIDCFDWLVVPFEVTVIRWPLSLVGCLTTLHQIQLQCFCTDTHKRPGNVAKLSIGILYQTS